MVLSLARYYSRFYLISLKVEGLLRLRSRHLPPNFTYTPPPPREPYKSSLSPCAILPFFYAASNVLFRAPQRNMLINAL